MISSVVKLTGALVVAAIVLSGCRTIRDVSYVNASEADRAGDYVRAAELYKYIAEDSSYDGTQASNHRLAQMYMEGLGVAKSPIKALSLFEEAAKGPDKTWQDLALFSLGNYAEEGIPGTTKPDRIKAAKYYSRCAGSRSDTCKTSLKRLSNDPEVYVHLHNYKFRHANGEIAPAGMGYALSLFNEGKKQEAFPIFLWHARNGNAMAQLNVGFYYKTALSGKKDQDLYKAWVWLAARNGNHNAQLAMGFIYREGGILIRGSDLESEKWFSKAAKQGSVEAYNALGVIKLHPSDDGLKSDHALAFKYFKQAADAGSVNAMLNLADMYAGGMGIEENAEIAKKYYFAAAREGNVQARTRLFEKYSIVYDPKKTEQAELAALPKPKTAQIEKKVSPPPTSPTVMRPIIEKSERPTPVELYFQLSPSVMRIFAANMLQKKRGLSQGSAVAIAPNIAVTNCHVIEGMDLYGTKLRGKSVFFSYRIGDKKRDICLIQSKSELKPVKTTRAYDELKVGEKVYAIGSPKSLENTLSEGLVSGLRQNDGVRYIQTTAPITNGSSGGGLFDEQGRLIGITTFVRKGGGNLNFAVAIDEALSLLSKGD
jgi:TPR repeat protein